MNHATSGRSEYRHSAPVAQPAIASLLLPRGVRSSCRVRAASRAREGAATFRAMTSAPTTLAAELADAVREYRDTADAPRLFARLEPLVAAADLDTLAEAVQPWRDLPEVAGPIYERIVAERPDDARALVGLANAWWLTGRGPEMVGELASRAIAADPANRAGWHLWALSEPGPRERTRRWQQVCARFPDDELAKALFADNAASLAGAESDPVALKLAIGAYEDLLARATRPEQRAALEGALATLRKWRP